MDALAQWAAVTLSMHDTEGRPLGETKAGLECMRGVPLELRRCPYPGSRHEHERPMNLSALKQVSTHWHAILGGIGRLRMLHAARAGHAPLRIADVWRIGNMTNALADFAFLRTKDPFQDRELPSVIGALYKISLGVTSTSAAVWTDGFADFSTIATVGFLYDYAESYGQLIGPEQVCGGSEAMIKELLSVAVLGSDVEFDDSETVRVIGDEGRFAMFCDGTAALRLLRIALERMDVVLRWELLTQLGEHLSSDCRARLESEIQGDIRLHHFVRLDPRQRLLVLDDLLAQFGDDRFSLGADLSRSARDLRDEWTKELAGGSELAGQVVEASARARRLPRAARALLASQVARYLDLEIIVASVVKRLKRRIADALGIEQGTVLARQRGLVDFEPRRIRPSMRRTLHEAFAIEVSAEACRVAVSCGDVRREVSPPAQSPLDHVELVRK